MRFLLRFETVFLCIKYVLFYQNVSLIPEQIAVAKVKKNRRNLRKSLARATGLEPVTYGLTVRCSTD